MWYKKIISGFSLIAILIFNFTIPSYAATDYVSRDSFWNWVASGGQFQQKLVGYASGKVCTSSPDTYHHASEYLYESSGRYACVCEYCGQSFTGYATDLQQSYEEQVSELPASGIGSDGCLYWQPSFKYGCIYFKGGTYFYFGDTTTPSDAPFDVTINSFYSFSGLLLSGSGVRFSCYPIYKGCESVPVTGYYSCSDCFSGEGFVLDSSGTKTSFIIPGKSIPSSYYVAGAAINSDFGPDSFPDPAIYSVTAFSFSVKPLVFQITPLSGLIDPVGDSTYNINTRPGFIVGLYGDINGEAFSNNSLSLVNETEKTVYNPVTNTTSNITDWQYDYSTRTYTVTLDNGTTQTITYGDENVTIVEGDTTYNVYYLTDGSGENPDPGPEVCNHSWTETSSTAATCTVPGSKLLTCSLCNETKTETIPAPGHTWQIKQTVATQYDDTGQLIQQGYTIFECSVCQEQYKSEDGTVPPSGGSDTDPGGEGESLWDKLGQLIGSIGGGLLELVGAVVGKVLDGLIALVEMITEKLGAVVEAVLSIFDALPALFGGFLDFLAAVFPFLPPEITTLLTFGVAAVVFIGIIKAIRR